MSKWSEARDYEERLRCECEGSTRSIRECKSLDCEYRKIWETTIEALEIAERVEKHWNRIKDNDYYTDTENCLFCEKYEDGFKDAVEYAVRGDEE